MEFESRVGKDSYCKALTKPETEEEKMEQRVEIAKDVLGMINARRLIPLNGQYIAYETKEFSAQFDDWYDLASEEYDKALGDDGDNYAAAEAAAKNVDEPVLPPEHASACAIGSVFVAALDRHDALLMGDLETPGVTPSDEDMIWYLEPWWSDDDLRLMENIFECRNWDDLAEINADYTSHEDRKMWMFKRNAIEKAKDGVGEAEATLVALMENIIKHNGELVL